MELQWNKKPCPYLQSKLRQVQNQEQTQELRLPEGMPDIGRVLCAWGQPMLRSKEWRTDGMTASGGVTVTVMYVPEDGTAARSVEVWIPFQMKWSFPSAQREGAMRVQCLLRSVDARVLSARKMMVRASVGALAEALEPAEAEICAPERQEGVELLTKVYPAVLPRETGEKQFYFEDDVRIPGVKKWLCWDMQPELAEQNVVGDRAVFRGSGQLHYVYMDEQDNIFSGLQEISFAQFGELDREYDKEATLDVLLSTSALESEITPEGAHIRCGVTAQYVVWERVLLDVAEDAYSPNREISLTQEQLSLPMELDCRTEIVEAQMPAQEGTVLDVTFQPDHPTQDRQEDGVVLEVSGSFQVLYQDADGNLQAMSEPWSCPIPMPSHSQCRIAPKVMGCHATQPGGGVRVKLQVQTTALQEIPMITGMNLGEPLQKEENGPSLILKRMDADSLWDMAKSSGSTVEAIRKANGLNTEPMPGQMLLIPVL